MYTTVVTRPDIAQIVGRISRSTANPRKVHWEAALRVLGYLKGTAEQGLRCEGECDLEGMADASWASDDKRGSTSGWFFALNEGAVVWGSKRQKNTANSTAESEYYAAGMAAMDAVWLKQLLKDLGMPVTKPIRIGEDNKSCIEHAKNPTNHSRMKHIEIKWHYTRELVERKTIELYYINTHRNVSDMLTKSLSRDVFLGFRTKQMAETTERYDAQGKAKTKHQTQMMTK